MTTKPVRSAGAIALIAAAATLSGCAGVIGAKMTYDDTEKSRITAILLSGGHGDVEISTAAGTQTMIRRIVHNSTNPGASYHVTGTTLNLDTSCGPDCWVSYEIQAPPGVAVGGDLRSGDLQLTGVGATDVRVTSGDVIVRAATAPVKVRGTSGDIQVVGAKGAVTVATTSGDIRAVDATGPVDVSTRSGDVQVRLTTPNSVTAEVTSGDVMVSVPRSSYVVRSHTSGGDQSITGLTSDPAAKNVIDVKAASGDVNIAAND